MTQPMRRISMEGNGLILGWVAIGLGVLALVVALGGRARPMGYSYEPQGGFGPPVAAAPPSGFAPQQAAPPQAAPPRGRFAQPWAGPERSRFGGPHGFGGFFFMPFLLIGGL